MKNFTDWTRIIAKNLKHEADLLSAIDKYELDDSAAQQAFIRAVLQPFLPDSYAVGTGSIVDAYGHTTDKLDIIVYRRDFPKMNVPGSQPVYLYESVLAAFEVKSRINRKTCFEALDHCASLASLNASVEQSLINSVASKNGLKRTSKGDFVHSNPLITARFNLLSRPPAFIFGFNGIKTNYRQLQENIELWIESRNEQNLPTRMKTLPAVIATQGCFATRNAAPFSTNHAFLMGVGSDDAPIALVINQLLYNLNRRLRTSANSFGVKPTLDAYLEQLAKPDIEAQIGSLSYSQTVTPKAPAALSSKISSSSPSPALAPKPERPVKPTLQDNIGSTPGPDKSGAFTETIKQQTLEPVTESTPRRNPNGAFLQPVKAEALESAAGSKSQFESNNALAQTVKLSADNLNSAVTPETAPGGSFLNNIKERIAESNPVREPFPELKPTSEPEPEPFISTIPQLRDSAD